MKFQREKNLPHIYPSNYEYGLKPTRENYQLPKMWLFSNMRVDFKENLIITIKKEKVVIEIVYCFTIYELLNVCY